MQRADALLEQLQRDARPVGDIRAPTRPGVYAWFLDDPGVLPGIPGLRVDPIYIGMSLDLRQRGEETHFSDDGTGFSTLRRSLGALLKQELGLRARPRGTGTNKQNYRCYRFDEAGDKRLTTWMREHLRVAVAEHHDPNEIETELIRLAQPPLNLNRWSNPYRPLILTLRKACVAEAERNHGR